MVYIIKLVLLAPVVSPIMRFLLLAVIPTRAASAGYNASLALWRHLQNE